MPDSTPTDSTPTGSTPVGSTPTGSTPVGDTVADPSLVSAASCFCPVRSLTPVPTGTTKPTKLPERSEMLDRMYVSDQTADGVFIVGVTSTTIYCLPSCGARKPQAVNIEFYQTEPEVRGAGFRACKRCRPDDFYANRNRDLERLQAALGRLESEPRSFADISELARDAGFGRSKLHELMIRYYDITPGLALSLARVEKAKQLLATTTVDVLVVGQQVGFKSTSTFYSRFKSLVGVTPAAFRRSASHDRCSYKEASRTVQAATGSGSPAKS